MLRHRATKIIATLGPASSSPEMIESLFLSGVDLFRLNFSHGSHEGHGRNVESIRSLSEKYKYPIGIIQDLQGPKLRVGTFEKGEVLLEAGQPFALTQEKISGTQTQVCLPHPEIFSVLKEGHTLLLNDGLIRLEVTKHTPERIETVVKVGGVLSDRKGVNVPDVSLPVAALTPRDLVDLDFGLKLGVDWVALSFVQRPEDILQARELIKGRALIASKLEKPQAIEHLEEIVELSDAILIARGDLGVELPPEDVPPIQKRIINVCRTKGTPVIVATQMLESMVHAPTPTRAETSDVANAVYGGVDAVMLSAESASGQYPQESVAMMNRIIETVERDPLYLEYRAVERTYGTPSTSCGAITAAARQVAHTIHAKAIVTMTRTGGTSLRAANERPEAPILAMTPDAHVANQLTLAWGVFPKVCHDLTTFSQVMTAALDSVVALGLAREGDNIVLTAGGTFTQADHHTAFASGSTRILRILTVGEVV